MGNDLWSAGTVRSILRNEKYCGDALMQKTYTKDFRTHKSVKNTDLNMYFKENHHTAIIKKRGLDQGTKATVRAAQHSKTNYIAPFEQSLRRIPRKGWSFQGLSDHGFPLVFYGTSGVYENRG